MATIIANFLGPLVGVLIGGAIAVRSQSSAFNRERQLSMRTEKRETYLRFVAAARSWQAATLNPEVKIMGPTVYRGRKYADAGSAYAESIRALTEVRLVGSEPVIAEAWGWDRSLRRLSDAIAQPHEADINRAVEDCQDAERKFVAAARAELDRN